MIVDVRKPNKEFSMKTFTFFLFSLALVAALSLFASAQQSPAATPKNLLPGIGPLLQPGGSSNWTGISLIENIPGTSLYPITSDKAVFYIGFTAGTTVDIGNMVLYTTARESLVITAINAVRLQGVSNPSISLTDTKICPIQPLSGVNPCILRLDPIQMSLSPLNDYYFTVYFTQTDNDTHVARPRAFIGSLTGGEDAGKDDTQLKAGALVPDLLGNGDSDPPSFLLVAVMDN
jgi:hypothetical protein